MKSVTALEAKTRFGALLDSAQRGPVTIEKHGRPVAVVVSAEDYKEIEELRMATLRRDVQVGLRDVEAGRTVDGARAFRALRKRLG
ncbi:MAG: type II toxin-antitoxin system Phd/YefM family antitoxin [Alphaproteobacteria bacterium]